MKIMGPLVLALIAAVGNAVFALGQKKAAAVENGLTFIFLTATVAVVLAALTAPLLGTPAFYATIKGYWRLAVLSGSGLYLTYLGFNLLYTRYGTASYVVYAVLSIVSTTLVVGVFYFRETFNGYHWGAVACAFLTIVLFSLGQHRI